MNSVKETGQLNHRERYLKQNSSDIFGASSKSNTIKDFAHPLTTKHTRTKSGMDFFPKFKDETAFSRRMHEFYDCKEANILAQSIVSSVNTLHKEVLENSARSKPHLETTPTSFKKKSFIPNSAKNKEKRSLITEFYNSNIFNDPHKEECKTPVKPKIKEKHTPAAFENKKVKAKGNLSCLTDWKKPLDGTFNDNNSKLSPFQLKQNNYHSIIFGENEFTKNVQLFKNSKTPVKENTRISEEVKEYLQTTTTNHIRKNIDMASNLHSETFYKQNFRESHKDRDISEFQMKPIKNKENQNIEKEELRRIFTEKGLHVYGIDIDKKHFKLRTSKNDKNVSNKITDVMKEINSKGFEVVEKSTNPTRGKTKSFIIPAKVHWADVRFAEKSNGVKPNLSSKKMRPSQKFINSKVNLNLKYKNNELWKNQSSLQK